MSIEITDIADVQDGDIVTLRWREEPGITVTLEGPAQDSTVGDFRITRGRFVTATREAPEWEPGTAGTATVRGVEGVRVMRTSGTGGADVMWLSASMVSGVRGHEGCDVTDFLPDDAATLRTEAEHLSALINGSAQYLIPVDRASEGLVEDAKALRAEVERLRAARTVPTREQVAMSMYAELKGAIDLSWGRLDPIDRGEWERAADTVLALIEQGGAS